MIRHGEEKDIERITDMGVDFWAFSPYGVEADRDSIKAHVRHCINDGVLLVLEGDSVIKGFIAGIIGPVMGNMSYNVCTELAWWVDPQYRTGRNGILLKREFKKEAKSCGADFVAMAYMEGSMPEAIKGIYEKDGMSLAENLYLKRL